MYARYNISRLITVSRVFLVEAVVSLVLELQDSYGLVEAPHELQGIWIAVDGQGQQGHMDALLAGGGEQVGVSWIVIQVANVTVHYDGPGIDSCTQS
jgi:hypothetical protein